MSPDFASRIGQDLKIAAPSVAATLSLLEEGATVPFIARYRKDQTGHVDETGVRRIVERHAHYKELEDRRDSLLARLANQGRLDENLRRKIESAASVTELGDLSLAHRPRRGSRASAARARGLEPLADYIQEQSGSQAPEERALGFLSIERDVPRVAVAISGALDILAERIAANPETRQWYRKLVLEQGVVNARALPGRESEKSRYSAFYDFSEPVSRIPSHRYLALRRGARKNVLSYSIEVDREAVRAELRGRIGLRTDCAWAPLIEQALDDALDRLLAPIIQGQVRALLRERADSDAIRIFTDNLRALLLAPPAGPVPILGIDAGGSDEAHLAALDGEGRLIESQVVGVGGESADPEAGRATIQGMMERHAIRGVAIGEGARSEALESLCRGALNQAGTEDRFVLSLSRTASAAWARSPAATNELPDVDAGLRTAVSIARRVQDPLAELVRVDAKAIGVGQYPHDVSPKRLSAAIDETLEAAVCSLGADVNSASADLLSHIAGLGEARAQAIVAWRNENGALSRREDLRSVPGIDEEVFRQAAGFLTIPDGPVALDRTRIHPESYALVERMAAGAPVAELIGNAERVRAISMSDFESEIGRFTLADIRRELLRPGQDPRGRFQAVRFRDDIRQVSDLEIGMELEGQVTNVTHFGAFVNLGVHQDGLIHISELSHGYVPDARRAVRVGDRVRVKVIALNSDDTETKRISLSRKALLPKPSPRPKRSTRGPKASGTEEKPRPPRKSRQRKAREQTRAASARDGRRAATKRERPNAAEPAPVSMEEKIRQLREKFRGPDEGSKG